MAINGGNKCITFVLCLFMKFLDVKKMPFLSSLLLLKEKECDNYQNREIEKKIFNQSRNAI